MKLEADTIWKQAAKHLEGVLSADIFARWIAPIKAQKITEDNFVLIVSNDFYQSWLEEHYLPLIKDAVMSITGKKYSISFTVDHSAPPNKQTTQQTTPNQSSSRGKSLWRHKAPKLNSKYTFDAFVVGPSNNFSHAASLAVSESPASAYNPLFIHGASGLGKTHLMQAVGHVVSKYPRKRVSYLSCEAFVNEYIDALTNKKLVSFRKKYRNTDLLLIDDIHFLAGKERMQEEFFHTFNALFDNHKQLVLTSDRPASDIPNLEHRLVTRFEWGLVTELQAPDTETRIAILRKKRMEHKLDIGDDILSYLAEHIRSNIRRLEGALIRTASFASLTGGELSIETVDHLLRDMLDQEQPDPISVNTIKKQVAAHYDLRVSDLMGSCRQRSIARPRQLAMYLTRDMTDLSLPVIGKAFEKNHATVLHACRTVQDKIHTDAELRRAVSSLRQKITTT